MIALNATQRARRAAARPPLRRRGSTLMLVLWVVTITSLIVIPLQLSAQRQAVAGREALGRVRARWAARAAIESYIAYLEWQIDTEQEVEPTTFKEEMEELAHGTIRDVAGVLVAEYHVQHWINDELTDGPADAHAKINLNLLDEESLGKLEDITPEMIAAILDWMDPDDDVREGGAEAGYYNHPLKPYDPRNGPFKNLQELELVYGITPLLVRGEDWNLNGVLDPNEDDGPATWPDDNADGRLDAGWSALLTTSSVEPGPLADGNRLSLSTSAVSEIRNAFGIDQAQANALFHYSRAEGNTLEGLLTTPLSTITRDGQPNQGGQSGQVGQGEAAGGAGATGGTGRTRGGANRSQQNQTLGARDLTDEQIGRILAGATIGTTYAPKPGRLNINTAPVEVLELLPGVDEALADQIDWLRHGKSAGITSLVELLQIPTLSRETLAAIAPYIDVRSNTFVITASGAAIPGRTEVQLVVTIDRSSLPIRILEYIER